MQLDLTFRVALMWTCPYLDARAAKEQENGLATRQTNRVGYWLSLGSWNNESTSLNLAVQLLVKSRL